MVIFAEQVLLGVVSLPLEAVDHFARGCLAAEDGAEVVQGMVPAADQQEGFEGMDVLQVFTVHP